MTVSDEDRAVVLQRFRAARAAAGLSPMIDDERTLRTLAALVIISRMRDNTDTVAALSSDVTEGQAAGC